MQLGEEARPPAVVADGARRQVGARLGHGCGI
jgi:hypothetical protein